MATLLLAEGMKRAGHGMNSYAGSSGKSTPIRHLRDQTPRRGIGLPQIKARPRRTA
jgi:hypothetical protein